jgi:hypothetical protein
VRDGPGSNYKILGKKYKNEIVDVVDMTGTWAKIPYNNAFGYVSLEFLEKQSVLEISPSLVEQTVKTNNSTISKNIKIVFVLVSLFILFLIIKSTIKKSMLKKKNNITLWEKDNVKESSVVLILTSASNNALFETGIFNILDVSTWDLASDSTFIWKNDITFFNEENGKNITEKEFSTFIGQIIDALRQVSSDEKISIARLTNIIALIIDLLSSGINATNALILINMGLENNINFSWPIFKIDRTIGANNEIFNIDNQDTWKYATENNLIWEGKPFNISSEKKFTEILFVKIIALLFHAFLLDLYLRQDLRNVTISNLLDGLKQDKNITDISNQITNQLKTINVSANSNNRVFDISDISTWEFASEQYIIWNNKLIYGKDERPVTEKEIANLFNSIFALLERKGEKLTSNYKIEKAKGLLNRLANPTESNNEKQTNEPRNEAFDPRNPETYQFATNNQLILDGVQIYNEYHEDNGDIIREPILEKEFVRKFSMHTKIDEKIQKWDEALNIVRVEFQEYGIDNPGDSTEGYLDRINKVYHDLLEQPQEISIKSINDYKKQKIENYIKLNIDLCSPMPQIVKSLDGYGFTQAQLEVLGSLPDEALAAIGKTMSSGLRGGKLKQALFNAHGSLNRDWHYLVELNSLNEAFEKEIMLEYFYSYEFETEDEVKKLLDESEYLKGHNELKVKIYEHFKEIFIDDYFAKLYDDLETKEEINKLIKGDEYLKHHPTLKNTLLKNFGELILKNKEEQSKSIEIKNFTIHDDIKQLLWFADGPLKNLTKEQMEHDKNAISLKIQFEPDDPRFVMCKELNLTIDEPSLIYTKKAIIQPQDGLNVPVPYYSPRYKDLSPEQRWMYLQFLANPYNTDFDIGYVFILYYGLERHLLQGDFDDAFKVIIKLRDVHTNKSFQKYSGNAVILSSLLKCKGEYAVEFVKSLDTDYKFWFSDNLLLLCYYSFNIPLLPKHLMRMAKTFGFTKTNYIKKSPDVFEKCLLNTIKEKIGSENIDVKKYIFDSELDNLPYENTPVYVNSSIIGNTVPVPMITNNSRLKKEMNFLLESAHEATKTKLSEMRKAARKIVKSERLFIEKGYEE